MPGRELTSASVGALNEIMRKERRSMDLWCRQDTSLMDEPVGSPLLQAPYCFGAPPGMPASVEYLRRYGVGSVPQLPAHRQPRRRLTVPLLPATPAPAAADPLPRTLLPSLGPRAWRKERLLEAEDSGTDALSVYVMRKHSRRFMPGSHHDLELRGKQPRRLLSSMSSEGLLPAPEPLAR